VIEHISNCHGEWNILWALLGSIPFIGAWLRSKFRRKRGDDDE